MSDIRLSIIVPFYNVEKYIERCIRSLYNQDIPLKDYEVICVDDCGTDQSRAIVESLQREYPTLKLITHEHNKKLGGARNTGLKAAKGEYVWFVDSDDYIQPKCLSVLLRVAQTKQLEVLQFDYCTIAKDITKNITLDIDNRIYSGEDFVDHISETTWYYYIPSVWHKLYKRKFLIDNALWFPEGVMYEDTDWSFNMLSKTIRMAYTPKMGYCYRINETSITHSKKTGTILVYMILQLNRCAIIQENMQNNTCKKIINKHINSHLMVLRNGIKDLKTIEKIKYCYIMSHYSLKSLKPYSNWRTWLSIRYAITFFL